MTNPHTLFLEEIKMKNTNIGVHGRLWISFLLAVGLLVGGLAALTGTPPQASQAATAMQALYPVAAAPLGDLEIIQTGPQTTFPGKTISYTLLLINHGATAIEDITLVDTWRTDILGKSKADFDDLWEYGPLMSFDGYSASNPALIITSTQVLNQELQRGEATWGISALPAGSSLEIIFTATTPIILQPAMANYPYEPLISKFRVMGPSTLQNTVSALVGTTEYPAEFSTATVMAPLLDIKVDTLGETVGKNEGRVGRLITYTLAVENVSAAKRVDTWPANNLVVSVTLPYQLNYAVLDIMASEAGVTHEYNNGEGFIQWIFPPTFVLTPGTTTQMTFTARIPITLDYNSEEKTLLLKQYEGVTARAALMPLRPASIGAKSNVQVLSPFDKTGVGITGKATTIVNEPVTYTLTFYNPVAVNASMRLLDLLPPTFVFSQVVAGSPQLLNATAPGGNIVAWESVSLTPYEIISVTFVTTPTYATLFDLECNKKLDVTNSVSATSPAFPPGGYIGHNDDKLAKITVNPQIKVSKKALPTAQFPGESVTYTISLENQGQADMLQRGIVTDNLPIYFAFITMTTGSPVSYPLVITDTLVQWTDIPTIPTKSTLNIPFVAEVDGRFPESYKNWVFVDIPGVMRCEFSGASVGVLPPFFVNKTADLAHPVVQGEIFTYTADIINISPRMPYTITQFRDVFSLENHRTGLVTPDTLLTTYNYTLTSSAYLTPGGEGTWEHTFPVMFQGYGISEIEENTKWCDNTFSNKVLVSLQQPSRSFRYKFTSTSWVVNASPDGQFTALPHISLFQQAYPNPVAISQPVTIVLTLRDHRADAITPAQNVLLRWEIPTGFEFINSAPIPITQTASELIWQIPSVPLNDDVRVIFSLRAPNNREPGWSKTYNPLAQVIDLTDRSLCIPKTTKFAYSVDPAEIPVDGIPGPIPDDSEKIGFSGGLQVNQGIEINKKPKPNEIGPYGTVEYEISVKNLTGAPVASVVITDILPTYYGSYPWTYLEMVSGQNPDSESPLVWRLPSLPPKSTTSLVFTTRANNWLGVALNAVTGTAPINLIEAKSYEKDRLVIVSSGIGFFKEAAPEAIYAGDLVTYTITLFNGEAYKLGNIVITDTLPAGFTFDSMVSPAGLTPQGTTTLVWRILGTLNSGSPYVIRFRARANTEAQGMFTGVYYNEMSAGAWNDQTKKPVLIPPTGPTAPVHVQGRPAVVVDKTASVSQILPDEDLIYTIGLYNEADEAVTLQVTDTLPLYFTLAEALTPTQAITSDLGNQQLVSWQNLTIAPTSRLTLTFRAHVAAEAKPGGYYNQVQVQINEFVTPVVPKLARVEVLIPYKVDAQVSSTNGVQVVRPAPETITYTIHYTNAAASEIPFSSITLTVAFSPTEYVSVLSGNGWVQSGDQYHKGIAGPLAPGESGQVELLVQLAETLPPEVLTLYYRGEIAYTTDAVAFDANLENNYIEDIDLIAVGESVSLLKVAAASSVRATEEVTYVVTLFNNHPTLSYTVRLSDTLPPFFTWSGVVATTPAPVLQQDERIAVWENIIIESGELKYLSYRTRVDLLAPGPADYCNTLWGEAGNNGIMQPPVTAQSCVNVIPAGQVDVAVTKSNGLEYVQPGDTMTYTILYENTEASNTALSTIILTETVSPYTDIQQAYWVNTPGEQTNLGGGRYRIEIPETLEPGGMGVASFVVKLNSTVPTTTATINNMVEVGYQTQHASIETNFANNVAWDTDPIQHGEVIASKSASPTELTAGEEIEYRITLNNPAGGAQVLNVLDTLPPGVVFVSAVEPATGVTTAWVGGQQQVLWRNLLLQTTKMELVFRTRVKSSSPGGLLCNTVQIERRVGGVFVPQPAASGLACVNVTALPAVDAQISKDDGMSWTNAGETLIYTLRYTNATSSPQSFTAVTLTDRITPPTLVAQMLSADWTAVGDGVYQYVAPDTLAPGASRTVNFVVRLNSTLAAVTELENSATITYATAVPVFEQNQANNIATDIDLVVPLGTGEITPWKSVTPDSVAAGGIVTYTIQLFNTGDTARTARITDTLPLSFTLASGTPDATGVSAGQQQLIWHNVNIPAHDQVQLVFAARVAAGTAPGSYCNQVQGLPDVGVTFAYSGACVAVTTVVIPVVDVQVTKTDGITQFSSGDRLTYTLHYASLASSEATLTQVVLTETIAPAESVTLVSSGWTALGNGRYTREIGALAPNASGDVNFVVQVNGSPAAITNTVEIGYPPQNVREIQLDNNRAVDINTLKSVTPLDFEIYLPLVIRQ